MLKDKKSIPTPPKGGIIIFRDIDDGAVYYKSDNGSVGQAESYHGVYRIQNPNFRSYNVISEERLVVLTASPSQFIFALYRAAMAMGGGRSGGGGGIRGIIVEDQDVPFSGTFTTLNFEGAGVVVTDDGGGKATVTIGGGGMIFGAGTPDRLAMFTAPNTIGDSPFLRSGSDVIADGDMYFSTGNGIDVVATGGSDVLSIGTANADIINYGYSGTTHNFEGATFNASTTNLNVEDKLITINDGGAAGSGGSAGFEIEEGGVATGYFIQNSTRNGFNFQASAITGVATFSLALLTANRTATLQDASGTIAYLSDIPVVTSFFAQGGNSFGATARLGTNDAFALEFETSNTLAGTISTSQLWSIGAAAPIAGVRMLITGTTNDATASALRVDSTTVSSIFRVQNDGYISAGLANGSMTIGLGSGFISTIANNTFIGVNIAASLAAGGSNNTAVGSAALNALTTGSGNTAVGFNSLNDNNIGSDNSAFGFGSLAANTSGSGNSAFGEIALASNLTGTRLCAFGYSALLNNTGSDNTAMGYNCLVANTTGVNNTGIGSKALLSNTEGSSNTVIGFEALRTNTTNFGNVAIGYQAGLLSTGIFNIYLGTLAGSRQAAVSNRLFIDNQDRGSAGADITNALIYGFFDATTAAQFLRVNANLGILTNTFGTSADGVIGIANGTVPSTSPADMVQIFSVDISAGNASLGLRTETAVVTEAVISDRTLSVTINGTVYKICLKA